LIFLEFSIFIAWFSGLRKIRSEIPAITKRFFVRDCTKKQKIFVSPLSPFYRDNSSDTKMIPVYDPGCVWCIPIVGVVDGRNSLADDYFGHRVYRPTPMVLGYPQPQPGQILSPPRNNVVAAPDRRVLYKVLIPPGTAEGEQFLFRIDNRKFITRCPPGSISGDEVLVSLPASATPVAHIAEYHESEPLEAVVIFDHIVDENRQENIEHQILSVPVRERVLILSGTIEYGLPPPYSEYCRVQLDNGRIGMISRHVLKYSRERINGQSEV